MTGEETLLSPPSATDATALGPTGEGGVGESGDGLGAPRVELAYEPRYQRYAGSMYPCVPPIYQYIYIYMYILHIFILHSIFLLYCTAMQPQNLYVGMRSSFFPL